MKAPNVMGGKRPVLNRRHLSKAWCRIPGDAYHIYRWPRRIEAPKTGAALASILLAAHQAGYRAGSAAAEAIAVAQLKSMLDE